MFALTLLRRQQLALVKLQQLYFIRSAAQLVSLHDYFYLRMFIDWPDSNWCCQTGCRRRVCEHTAHSQWCGLLQQNHCRVRGSLHLWGWLSPGWCRNESVPEWWRMEWQYTSVLLIKETMVVNIFCIFQTTVLNRHVGLQQRRIDSGSFTNLRLFYKLLTE